MTPQDIAKGLSEADRTTLLSGACRVPRSSEEWTAECICDRDPSGLIEKGLAYRRQGFPGGVVRSALGLAVRSILQEGK